MVPAPAQGERDRRPRRGGADAVGVRRRGRARRGPSSTTSPPRTARTWGCSSTSSGSRRRARGSAAAPTSSPSPSGGSGRNRRSTSGAAWEHLVRHYLSGFGPASAAEIANWAGVKVGTINGVVRDMDADAVAGRRRRGAARSPRARDRRRRRRRSRARFIGTWEALLLVHARRAEILAEEDRPRLFSTRTPQSFNTFLVDGTVARHVAVRRRARRRRSVAPVDAGRAGRGGRRGRAPGRVPRLIAARTWRSRASTRRGWGTIGAWRS